MAVGALTNKNMSYDDYIKKLGINQNDIKGSNPVTGMTNGISNKTIQFARENDIFTANKKFGSTQSSEKESSGAGAASSGGNFFSNLTNGLATWIVNSTQGSDNNPGALTAAGTGHTPTLQPLATPSGLTGTSGNENSGPEGGATQGKPKYNAMDLYQQFLDAQRQAEVADQTGEKPTGEATLGGTSNGADGVGGVNGTNNANGTNGANGANGADNANGAGGGSIFAAPAGSNPSGGVNGSGDNNGTGDNSNNPNGAPNNDPANNGSKNINQQQQQKLEEQQRQQEQERLKQLRQDENA